MMPTSRPTENSATGSRSPGYDSAMDQNNPLHPFEAQHFRGKWRDHLSARRGNLHASILGFGEIWDAFQFFDDIFARELDDMATVISPSETLPLILFFESHSRFRTAAELAFGGTIIHAWSVMRGAVECAAHAHKLHRQPALTRVWLEKSDGKQQEKRFRQAFEHDKANNLFPKKYRFLEELGVWWADYSDWGPHSGLPAIALNAQAREGGWSYNYLETDERRLASALFGLLDCAWLIENTVYDVHSGRLELDFTLGEMREQFAVRNKQIAEAIIARYQIPNPEKA